jgi:hypothetical protein
MATRISRRRNGRHVFVYRWGITLRLSDTFAFTPANAASDGRALAQIHSPYFRRQADRLPLRYTAMAFILPRRRWLTFNGCVAFRRAFMVRMRACGTRQAERVLTQTRHWYTATLNSCCWTILVLATQLLRDGVALFQDAGSSFDDILLHLRRRTTGFLRIGSGVNKRMDD